MIKKTIVLVLLLGLFAAVAFGTSVEIGGNPIDASSYSIVFLSFLMPSPFASTSNTMFLNTDVTLIEPLSNNFAITADFPFFLGMTETGIGGSVGVRLISNTIDHTFASPFKTFIGFDGGVLWTNGKYFPLASANGGILFKMKKNLSTYLEVQYCTVVNSKTVVLQDLLTIPFFIIGGIGWNF